MRTIIWVLYKAIACRIMQTLLLVWCSVTPRAQPDGGHGHHKPSPPLTPPPPDSRCPWLNEWSDLGLVVCKDLTTCNPFYEGDSCCNCNGGPIKCPTAMPNMCIGGACGVGSACCQASACLHTRPCPSNITVSLDSCRPLLPYPPPNPPRLPPPPNPPTSPPSPPYPPAPPARPPSPALPPGQLLVSTVQELLLFANGSNLVHIAVLSAHGSPYLLTEKLVLGRNLSLVGEAGVVLDARGMSSDGRYRRLLLVDAGATVVLTGLGLTGAWIPQGSNAGGALMNLGELTMNRCEVFGNVAFLGGVCGGIFNLGTLTLLDCSLYNNEGGGLENEPSAVVHMMGCILHTNSADYGGGMENNGYATVQGSAIYNNTANKHGGGILNHGTLTLTWVSLHDNCAGLLGGGILTDNSAVLNVAGSNLSLNTAPTGGSLAVERASVSTLATVAVVTSTILCHNRGEQGAAIYNTGEITLDAVLVCNNTALPKNNSAPAGVGIYNSGVGFLMNGTLFRDQGPVGSGNMYNGGKMTYILPAPLGFHLPAAILCQLQLCYDPVLESTAPCSVQSCDYILHTGRWVSLLSQGLIDGDDGDGDDDDEFPAACPPGFYGATTLPSEQSTSRCSGECPQNYFCADYATTVPTPAPAGTYAHAGSKLPLPCGDPSFYCPGGGQGRLKVEPGYIGVGGDGPTGRTAQASCPGGHWCIEGSHVPCRIGTFTALNFTERMSRLACVLCPPLSTTRAAGAASVEECVCTDGYYHVGSASTPCSVCPEETVCAGLNNSASTIEFPCPWLAGPVVSLDSFECADGSSCDKLLDGWDCCDCRGGISRCPSSSPHMCTTGFGSRQTFVCTPEECSIPRACPSPFNVTAGKCAPPTPPVLPFSPCLPPPPPSSPSPAGVVLPPSLPPGQPGQAIVATVVSLRAALADGGVSHVLMKSVSSPYLLDAELELTRNVTISAEGVGEAGGVRGAGGVGREWRIDVVRGVVLDARASELDPRRVLRVAARASVVLHGLSLKGAWMGQGTTGGGAVANFGRLSMKGCDIFRNVAFVGGALFNRGELELIDCAIHDNTATGLAGAVFSTGGSIYASGCAVYNNLARYVGGLDLHTPSSIVDSTISNNSASETFGGVYSSGSLVVLCGVAIHHNRAVNKGGGVTSEGNGLNFSSLTLIGCLVSSNEAERGSGVYNTNTVTITNTLVINNTATATRGFTGAGLYNTGRGSLTNGTLLVGNNGPLGSGRTIYNNGVFLTYVLPTPLGYHVLDGFLCEQALCFDAINDAVSNCPNQRCDFDQFGGSYLSQVWHGEFDDDFPAACPPGFYGATTIPSEQSTSRCSGECPQNYFCADYATTVPTPAPAGTYALAGSKLPLPCGDPSFYCPGDGKGRLKVEPGYIGVGGDGPTGRTAQASCPGGHWCIEGSMNACGIGTYTDAVTKTLPPWNDSALPRPISADGESTPSLEWQRPFPPFPCRWRKHPLLEWQRPFPPFFCRWRKHPLLRIAAPFPALFCRSTPHE